jgi:hypothetical protein
VGLSYAISTEDVAQKTKRAVDQVVSSVKERVAGVESETQAEAAAVVSSAPAGQTAGKVPDLGDLAGVSTLESALITGQGVSAVRDLLTSAEVFVLGEPAGDTSVPGVGSESDILHYSADSDGGDERAFMPLFTRVDVLKRALEENSEWESLSVLRVDGGALLKSRDNDVTLVINPWSKLEFEILPDDGASAETPPENS